MRVEEDSHENFKNWVEQYDLTCADEQSLALIGTLFFAGFSTGAIILPTASDKYGRKPFTIFGVTKRAHIPNQCEHGKALQSISRCLGLA